MVDINDWQFACSKEDLKVGVYKRTRDHYLKEFVRRVEAGEEIHPNLLRFIAYGVERYLNGSKTPWPTKRGGACGLFAQFSHEAGVCSEYHLCIEEGNMDPKEARQKVCERFDIDERTFYRYMERYK